MKAIFLAVLLVVAAQAITLDTDQYTLGFTQQLGFGFNQSIVGLECFVAINNTIIDAANLVQASQGGDSTSVTFAAFALAGSFDTVKEACQNYTAELLRYAVVSTNITTEEELDQVVHTNWERYTAQTIQQVTIWIDDILSNNAYGAGQTEAYILQILLGVQTPQQLVYPTYNYSNYVPFNESEFIYEYTEAYFNGLGIYDQDTINTYLQCAYNTTIVSPLFENFTAELQAQPTIINKIEFVRESFNQVSFLLESCVSTVEFEFGFFVAPLVQKIQEEPVETILTILHNYALNLPEIVQSGINQDSDMFTGNYAQVGQNAANIVVTILDDVLFN